MWLDGAAAVEPSAVALGAAGSVLADGVATDDVAVDVLPPECFAVDGAFAHVDFDAAVVVVDDDDFRYAAVAAAGVAAAARH